MPPDPQIGSAGSWGTLTGKEYEQPGPPQGPPHGARGQGLGTAFAASPDDGPETLRNVDVMMGQPWPRTALRPPGGRRWKVTMATLGGKEPDTPWQTVLPLSISS